MSINKEVPVPDIGDFEGVEVIEVLVKVGDTVAAEDSILTLESDKASMDVPAPWAGTVQKVSVEVGDKVSEGDTVLILSVEDADIPTVTEASSSDSEKAAIPAEPSQPAPATKSTAESIPAPATSTPMRPPPVEMKGSQKEFLRAHASPSIRKFARELGVDLSLIKGSGRKERITREDVQAFVKNALSGATAETTMTGSGIPAMPEVDFSKFGPIEIEPLSRIKKKSGANLHRGWLNVPIVTHHDEADITEMDAFRKSLKEEAARQDIKITPLAFLLKACAFVIRKHPNFNASLTPDGESLIMKKYLHIGVAVDTPDGLMVPVIRDVDQKGLFQLARELGEVSERTRNKKLKADDMQGGCFSISSLGGIGGTAFTPLVNAPEVAILGVTRSKMAPVWNGKEFIPRLMLPLDLTYDHRVIDGAQAARFMVDLCAVLSDLRRLLV